MPHHQPSHPSLRAAARAARAVTRAAVPALTLALLAAATGCRQPEIIERRLPGGAEGGRVFYDPERGIVREGAPGDDRSEQHFQRGLEAYRAGDYSRAAEIFASYRANPRTVEGSRALESAIYEARARLEAGRTTGESWLLGDLCDVVLDRDERAASRIPPAVLLQGGDVLVREAVAVSRSRAIERSWNVTRETFIAYRMAFGVAPVLRDQLERHGRNLAWLAYVAGNNRLAEAIAREFIDFDPSGDTKARVRLVLADASFSVGWYERAEAVYQSVADSGASAVLREEGMLGVVRTTIERSKGEEYDRSHYDYARTKIAEYRSGLFVELGSNNRRAEEFLQLLRDVNGVLHRNLLRAADTHRRLFQSDGERFFLDRAEAFRERADADEARFEAAVRRWRDQSAGASN